MKECKREAQGTDQIRRLQERLRETTDQDEYWAIIQALASWREGYEFGLKERDC